MEPLDQDGIDEEFVVLTCDGCGVPIRAPADAVDDVNYCVDCVPHVEAYDPEDDDGTDEE